MRILVAVGAMLAAQSASAAAPAGDAKPIEVMVLGTWHFDNPGRDLINVEADDVRQPKRQAELGAVAKAIAAFKPTKVMVERLAKTPDLIDPNFAAFTPAMLKEKKDERIQIGYRIAHDLKLGRVYAIDEQPSNGEPDYFPFGKLVAFDKAKGKGDLMQRVQLRGAALMKEFNERQATLSLPAMLALANAPDAEGGIGGYYEMLGIGNTEEQPGAELNGYWYMRNAKIFAKLMTVAEPGDRILVVYGAGHNYWLRHFASETPGFRNIDPVPYLKKATLRKP